MRCFSTLALLALPLFGSVFAEQAASPTDKSDSIYSSAQEAFHDLLNALPEESLQAALSGLKDFKSGVFESHHRGVEQVHDKNPALATMLIVEAVRDLKKRQNPSNGTTPIASPPPNETPAQTPAQSNSPPAQSPAQSNTPPRQSSNAPANSPAATTTERAVIIPVQQTTVNSQGQTIVQTTSVLSQVTASIAVTLTRTNAQGSAQVVTENRPAVIRTITDAQGRTTTTTSAAQFAPTAGEVRTETDSGGRTFLTTYTPGGGKISSIKLITTTGADGKPSTITSYTFVDPAATPEPQVPSGTQGRPGLQTGAAVANGRFVVGWAAVGGALAMLV